ncbi:hypothetical protein M8J77_025855 [Diaphorina citri]|nr:hypothetical protein M8J77_025855 [Diaphorina citri]
MEFIFHISVFALLDASSNSSPPPFVPPQPPSPPPFDNSTYSPPPPFVISSSSPFIPSPSIWRSFPHQGDSIKWKISVISSPSLSHVSAEVEKRTY